MKAAPEGVAMIELRRLIRPDFEGEKRAIWLDSDHLKSAERTRLAEHSPNKMSKAKRAEFLAAVALVVQQAQWLQTREAEASRKKKLQLVADKSRELLKAISNIPQAGWGEIRAFSDEFAFDEITPSPLSEQTKKAVFDRTLLPHIWDTVQDIESIFTYAASELIPDKQNRPSIRRARALVSEVAKAFKQVTGEWPPYSKGLWFQLFIADVGKITNCGDIGPSIVEAVIKSMKPPV